MKISHFLLSIILLIPSSLFAQLTVADYNRADSIEKLGDLVYRASISPTWIDRTNYFWYSVKSRKGREYFLVDAKSLKKKEAFNQVKFTSKYNGVFKKTYKPYEIKLKDVSFDAKLKEMTFIADSVKWKCNLANYSFTRIEKIKPKTPEKHWGEIDDELSGPQVTSNDSNWIAFIREYNVFVKNRKTQEETQLSFDGSAGEYYSVYISWSPDSKYLTTNKIRANVKKYIYFVESSPKNQIQPILHKREYLKPGDALPIKQPSLFSIEEKKQIPINTAPFENQFDLSNIQWYKDSRGFTFEFNQRGHQVYQVVEVNAKTGSTRIIIDERSPTFIDYNGKLYRHFINDGKEIIWLSERDGWNHLYLIDAVTCNIESQITRGEFVVRGVEYVNDSLRFIIFTASGKNPGEDPYLVHYYRVNFDGTGLTDLTPEQANHDATFSKDYSCFVDYYSYVNQPPITVLRSTKDGQILMQLEKADITDLLAKGWKAPEPFMAKGRDGKTDIWGNIYRPTNFDPSKKYPIVEYIYAGPHAAFVQKSFRTYSYAFSGLAELGFIVVQIDGMGTSYRSKAFHDVCYKNLKDAGFPDRILWIKAAAEKYPYMDTTRVGIFGGSAGGQSTMAGLLFHPEFYKAGVAACGCHDNRMDKMWWNELWMGYPIGPQYAACSNVENAYRLQGRLLLIVGEMDDNVDPASTMQVADALIKAGKDFELVVLPGMNHTLGGKYGERKRRDFFVKYLLNEEPPVWNDKK